MKDQAVTGALWSFADKLGAQILSFLSFLVMARILAPEDFGVISLAGVIVAVPALLLNEGFGIALIQRQEISDDHINAAFWANLTACGLRHSVAPGERRHHRSAHRQADGRDIDFLA